MPDTHSPESVPPPPAAANTRAIGPIGVAFQDTTNDRVIPRRRVAAWALWDWATQPFNSVVLTFVFASLYLVSDAFLPADIASLPVNDPLKERALADLSSGYGLITTFAGLLILVLAPVLGQSADRAGRKKRWLFVFTMLLALAQFALFFVRADPAYFWYGAFILAIGAVVSEIAGVNYNAMLVQVSTPRTIGKVSGLGWGLGYIGGIVALTLVVVITQLEWFGMDTSDGLAYRLIAVGCGVWTILFSLPLFLTVPEGPASAPGEKVNFFAAYVVLVKDVRALFRSHRATFWFLLASAVYRDGLGGVFAFGGILAAVSFGFSSSEVLIFAIAANVVAGVSTVIAGTVDDRFGARNVIITALSALIVSAVALLVLQDSGKTVFWVCGLVLSAAVGPAQAASRSLLARVTPEGMQGEIFGLYATTGRVASFLSPAMWTLSIAIFGATVWGVLGIAVVLTLGLVLLLFVRLPAPRGTN
jgi:UMF1 family MFS transporter